MEIIHPCHPIIFFQLLFHRDIFLLKCKYVDLFIDYILSSCLFRFLKIITFSPGKNVVIYF